MAFIDLERQTVFKTSEDERKAAINTMVKEEISGVRVYPEQFDPVYLALGERHLRPLLEDAMNVAVTQGLITARRQPVLVALLDVRYLPKGKFWRALIQSSNFNTQEKRIGNLRGQVDEHFGETVAFKYFNDGLKGMGLEKEGHSLGNEVLKAEAKGIIEDVIMKLERQNILLFRGPPDNWYFVFLNPVGRDYYESQEQIGEFVDRISHSFNMAFNSMGLDVEVKLRMNVVSSTDVGIAPGAIVSTVKHIARSRDLKRTKSYKTGKGNIVKIYNPGKRRVLDEELSLVRREDRLKAQGFLAEKISKAMSADAGQNAIATMRVMEQSGWLKEEGSETYSSIASNLGVEPKEVMENGVSIYSVRLPGTDRQVEICLDPDTIKLMQELPPGVTLNIFGNQAIQMILGREGVIAKTGELDKGDFDCYMENGTERYVDDAIRRFIRARHPENELQERLSKNIFNYLTSGPYTINRLVIRLASLGYGDFEVGFGNHIDSQAYNDLMDKEFGIAENIDIRGYMNLDAAIQGLIYHHRYGMRIRPEARIFIKEASGHAERILSEGMLSYFRLDKLFKSAKNPGAALEDIYRLGLLKPAYKVFIIKALIQTGTLNNALCSSALSPEAKLELEADLERHNYSLTRTRSAL